MLGFRCKLLSVMNWCSIGQNTLHMLPVSDIYQLNRDGFENKDVFIALTAKMSSVLIACKSGMPAIDRCLIRSNNSPDMAGYTYVEIGGRLAMLEIKRLHISSHRLLSVHSIETIYI